jgi:hypothetical protein
VHSFPIQHILVRLFGKSTFFAWHQKQTKLMLYTNTQKRRRGFFPFQTKRLCCFLGGFCALNSQLFVCKENDFERRNKREENLKNKLLFSTSMRAMIEFRQGQRKKKLNFLLGAEKIPEEN